MVTPISSKIYFESNENPNLGLALLPLVLRGWQSHSQLELPQPQSPARPFLTGTFTASPRSRLVSPPS